MDEERLSTMVVGFLEDVDRYLSNIVTHQEMLLEKPDAEIQGVWKEVKGRLNDFVDELRRKSEEEFKRDLEESRVSLTQLSWEIKEFKKARDEFAKEISDLSQIPRPLRWAAGGIIRKILRWLNIILGSLSAVFPPLGGVKEFKEVIEQKLK